MRAVKAVSRAVLSQCARSGASGKPPTWHEAETVERCADEGWGHWGVLQIIEKDSTGFWSEATRGPDQRTRLPALCLMEVISRRSRCPAVLSVMGGGAAFDRRTCSDVARRSSPTGASTLRSGATNLLPKV